MVAYLHCNGEFNFESIAWDAVIKVELLRETKQASLCSERDEATY